MTSHSYAFIVPFLNSATWIEQFMQHYMPIVLLNPNNQLIMVEGTTAFHSPSEHQRYTSVDGSDDIVTTHLSNQVALLKQGKVYQISELLNAGLRLAETQTFIMPLKPTHFIAHDTFRDLDQAVDKIDLASLHRVGLFKSFNNRLESRNGSTFLFRNMEGLHFENGQWLPYIDDKPLSEQIETHELEWEILDVTRIESRKQFERRSLLESKYTKWYHHNVKLVENYKDEDLSVIIDQGIREIENSNLEVEFKGVIPKSLRAHPWIEASFEDIWHYKASFPNFAKAPPQVKEPQPLARYNKSILEIGCSTGHVLSLLKEKGWTVKGIDPSIWATGYAKHALNLDVQTGTAADVNFDKDEFDIILLWDTFEHITNPKEFLSQIQDWLIPNGLLMIYTPHYDKFKDEKKHWLWSPRQHYFLYTPQTLTAMLHTAMFEVMDVDEAIDKNGFFLIAKKRM